jgi:methylated-DNA-[protein]-cysteine S-methyltransferase
MTHEPTADDRDAELGRFDELVDAPTRVRLDALHRRLVRDADDVGVLDIAYRTVDSPFGDLLIAATPAGVVRIAFEREGHAEVLEQLARTVSPRILRDDRRTDDAARQLGEYFVGHRRAFDLSLDLRLVNGFRRAVISHLRDIDYGSTESYAEVAAAAGNAKAVRAAGSACAHNPIPVVVPCHRVVRRDGSIGQYLGGTETKVALLALEGAT